MRGQKVVLAADGARWLVGETGPVEPIRNDEWHEFVVIARGNHLIHKIDGEIVCEIIDHDPEKRALEGLVGIQLHGGPAMIVKTRDVWLQVLPDAELLTPDETPLPADAQKLD